MHAPIFLMGLFIDQTRAELYVCALAQPRQLQRCDIICVACKMPNLCMHFGTLLLCYFELTPHWAFVHGKVVVVDDDLLGVHVGLEPL